MNVALSQGHAVVEKLTFGEKTAAAARAVLYKEDGSVLRQDVIMLRLWRLAYAIREGTIKGLNVEETYQNIYSLSEEDGEKLYEAFRTLGQVREGESMNSDNTPLPEKHHSTPEPKDSSNKHAISENMV